MGGGVLSKIRRQPHDPAVFLPKGSALLSNLQAHARSVQSRAAQPNGRRAMIAPSGEQIEIAVVDQQAVVVEVGGGLRSYSAGSRELVDGYRADEMSSSAEVRY